MTAQVKPAYAGEAMLLRWSDNHRGRTVTLELEPGNGDHPFKGLKCGENGQRMQICAVLVNESEQPVSPPTKPTPALQVGTKDEQSPGDEARERKHFKDMKPAAQAGMRIREPQFQEWLRKHYPHEWDTQASPEFAADKIVKWYLGGVTSKTELNIKPALAEQWSMLNDTYEVETRWGRS